MARLPFSSDPYSQQIDAEQAAAEGRDRKTDPAATRAAFEDVARQTRVPVNVLMALAEKDGAQDGTQAVESAKRHAAALQGKDMAEALDSATLDRAEAIGRAVYPDAKNTVNVAKKDEGERGFLTGVDDLTRTASGGVTKGVGIAVSGAGTWADQALTHGGRPNIDPGDVTIDEEGNPRLAPDALMKPRPDAGAPGTALGRGLRGVGGWITKRGEATQDRRSEGLKEKIAGSTAKGDFFKPSTWSVGDDPSVEGYLNVAVDALGSMAPIVLSSIFGGGAGLTSAVGTAQAAGGAGDDVEKQIEEWAADGTLAKESKMYGRLVAEGVDPAQALETTKKEAREASGVLAGIVGGAGGAVTNRIISKPISGLAGRGLATRVAGTGLISGAEEGVQEVLEEVGKNYAMNEAIGTDVALAEDTFGDFVGGFMAGAPVGAASGIRGKRDDEEPQPDTGRRLALPPPDGGLPAPDPVLALPPPDGGLPAPDPVLALPPPDVGGDVAGQPDPLSPQPPPPVDDNLPPPPPKGRLEAALESAPPAPAAPVLPGIEPGAMVSVTDHASGETFEDAVFVSEDEGGIALDIYGERVTVPRADIDAGDVSFAPPPMRETSADDEGASNADQPEPDGEPGMLSQTDGYGRGDGGGRVDGDGDFDRAAAPDLPEMGGSRAPGGADAPAGAGPANDLAVVPDAGQRDGAVTPPAPLPTAEDAQPDTDPIRGPLNAARAAGEVKHTTKKGKVLTGYVVEGFTPGQAKGVDPYAFRKDGGWFMRKADADAAYPPGSKPDQMPAPQQTQAGTPAVAQQEPAPSKDAAPLVGEIITPEDDARAAQEAAQAAGFEKVDPPTPQTAPWWRDADEGTRAAILKEAGRNTADEFRKAIVWDRMSDAGKKSLTDAYGRLYRAGVIENAGTIEAPRPALAVAEAAEATETAPTDAQKEAENYRTGKASWNGLRLSVENKKGGERSGTDPDGKPWSVTMPAHYGRILRTEGADGDHVDFYMGDNEGSDFVLVVDQKDADTGAFDEHKAIFGVQDAAEGLSIYKAAFNDGRGGDRIGGVREFTVPEFKAWLAEGDTKKPASPQFEGQNRAPSKPRDYAAEGKAAFEAGQMRRPPADLVKGSDNLQAYNKAAKAWLDAWDRANLAAPIPDDVADARAAYPADNPMAAFDAAGFKVGGDPSARFMEAGEDGARWVVRPAGESKFVVTRTHPQVGSVAIPTRRIGLFESAEAALEALRAEGAQIGAAAPSKPPARPLVNRIRNDKAITARGRELPVEYAIMDLADMIPSQTDEGRANPAYPAELQPRDRSGNKSAEQVSRIARELKPELLGEGPQASAGAPIVTPQGVVISGNGRTLALRQAYQRGPEGERYRAFLEAQGYDLGGMKQPALVRVLSEDMDTDALAATAREANERDTAAMSVAEQGQADSAAMSENVLAQYRGGDVDSAANRPFVRAFLGSVVAPSEMGNLIREKDGSMTQDAVRRVQAAMMARAYGDADLIGNVLEATSSNIRAIGGALVDVAAAWAKMRDAAKAGTIAPQMDQTAALLEAVRLVERARREGRDIEEYVGQQDMFSGDSISPMGKTFLGAMFRDAPKSYSRPRGRDNLTAGLTEYVDQAMKTQPGSDMLGHSADPQAVAQNIKDRADEQPDQQAGLFTRPDAGNGSRDGQNVPSGDGARVSGEPATAGGADQAPVESGRPQAALTPKPSPRAEAIAKAIYDGDPLAAARLQEEADREGWDRLAFHFQVKGDGGRFSYVWTDASGKVLSRLKSHGPFAALSRGEYRDPMSAFVTVDAKTFRPADLFREAQALSGDAAGAKEAAPKANRPKPGDADYTRDDAIADLHALEEQRDGGMVADARLEDRIRKQADLVASMSKPTPAEAAAKPAPDELPMPAGFTLGSAKKMNAAEATRVAGDPDASGGEWARGDFHAVIFRQSPYSVIGGYGKTRVEAINDAIRRAERTAKKAAQPAPQGWRQIGYSPRSFPLYEDERGVRSYVDGGIRITESVGIIPGGGISINTEARGREFLTNDEWEATRAASAPAENPTPAAFDADSVLDGALDDVLGGDAAPAAQKPLTKKGRVGAFTYGYVGTQEWEVRNEAGETVGTATNLSDASNMAQRLNGGIKAPPAPAPQTAPKAQRGSSAPSAPRKPRTAGEAASSAVKNTAEGVAGIVSGLNALFGDPNKLNSGLSFDEQTYAKAKPMFVAAVRAFGQAGQDIADLARAMVRGLAQNGLNRAAQENMRPYLTRFITDMNSGEVDPFADEQVTDGENTGTMDEGATETDDDAGINADADPKVDQGGVGGDQQRRPADANRPSTVNRPVGDGGEADPADAGAAGDDVAGGVVGDRAGVPVDPAAERSGQSPGNFVITPDFPLGEGTAGQKIAANLEAIRLVKALEAENRYATKAEQAALARYVGWGGLKPVFDPKKTGATDQWGRAQAELKSILTPEEYRAAARSTENAHYTAREVVGAMWAQMRRFGFEGGRAIEPTVGTGNFLGLMPAELSGKTEWYAAELDKITGQIAKHLYPDATVFAGKGFQDAPFRNGTMDVAIGNPPFGSEPVSSDLYPDIPRMSVHNFIIAKTGMHLRNGGIMGMVVTNRFLDTPNPQARSYLARHFDFIGAVRLPNTAFLANAGTEVTTDIVWFQKRAEGEPQGDLSWLETGAAGPNGTTLNGYFAANPDMMLGEPSMEGTMYGTDPEFTLNSDGRDLEPAMAQAMAKMEATLTERTEALQDAVVEGPKTSDLTIGQATMLDDGRIMLRRDDDADGNAVVEEVSESTLWGDAALPLVHARTAIEAARDAMAFRSSEVFTHEANEATAGFREGDAISRAIAQMRDAGSVRADLIEGTNEIVHSLKKTVPPGMGTAAHEALGDVLEGLADKTPYFGPKQKAAMVALSKAIDAKAIGPKRLENLRGILQLRRDTLALLAAERQDDPSMETKRTALRKQYRAFVKKFGYLNSSANERIVNGIPGIEAALESRYKPANKAKGREESAEEATILHQRVIVPYESASSAASAADGVHISLRERGRLDIPLIAKLTGKTPKAVREELTSGEKPLMFKDPKRDEYVLADEYLSGNLAEKITEAQRAGLAKNVAALEAAMPAPKTQEQITPSIRGLWIPGEVFSEFAGALVSGRVSVTPDPRSGTVAVDSRGAGSPTEFGAQFRTEARSVVEIFTAAVQGKPITVTRSVGRGKTEKDEQATREANAAVERMAKEFQRWAYANPERAAKIVDAFNEKMNVVVERKFDGVSYLNPVGANPTIKMRNSQKNGAWRMILSKSTLLHHVVGAGKTFTAITAVMERKRLGLSKKSLVAVPNHLVGQWARDFYALYPGANILAASEKDFSAKNRRKLIARMATGDYDAIIIGHSQIEKMENDAETVTKIMKEQIADLEQSLEEARRSGDSGRTAGQIQRRIEAYEKRLDALLSRINADNMGFTFRDIGIDNLVVDESHEFKNLEYATGTERVVGMNDPKGSKRAMDLYIKTRGLMGDGHSVGFLTGTPVSNSLVEIYTVLKYLSPDLMRSLNLMNFDAWASAFIEVQDRIEYTPAMKLKQRRVMSTLNNLGPLSQYYKTFADIVMRPQVEEMYREQIEDENAREPDPAKHKSTKFPTPKIRTGARRLVTVPSTPDHAEFTDYLVLRSEGIKRNASDKDYAKKDNILWVLSDARKAAIDIRTVDPGAKRHSQSKLVTAGNEILRIAKAWDADRGTQLVFADSSVPTKTAQKGVAGAIQSMWVRAGLPPAAAKARMKRDAGKPWQDQATAAMEAIETRLEDPDLSESVQEQIEEWLNTEGREALSMAETADSGFSFYDDLRAYLSENGMDPAEIAFIHDYDTAEKKAGLFEDVNEGRIRVLIGSTFKMGAGMNVQERLVGLHHIDAPWRPSDMEQREGRIIRQGNDLYARDPEGFEVEITAYATEKTADVVLWQVLERKAAGIEQFLNSTTDSIEEGDGDADQYAEFMAQSTGNPVFLKRMEAEKRAQDLEAAQSSRLLAIEEAKRFLNWVDRDVKRSRTAAESMRKISFGGFKDAGKAWADYEAALEDYRDAKAAHEAEADAVRERNEKRPKGQKAELLPKFERKAPQFNAEQFKPDAWTKKVLAAFDEAPGLTDGIGRAMVEIPITDDLIIELHHSTGLSSWMPWLRSKAADNAWMVTDGSVTIKDPRNSRVLMRALTPDAIITRAEAIARASDREAQRKLDAVPEMEARAAEVLDRSEIKRARREFEKLSGLVRLAEVEAGKNRVGKVNRFVERDIKGRDLKSEMGDDAPVQDNGKPFQIKQGAKTFTVPFGARAGAGKVGGQVMALVWARGMSPDGDQAVFRLGQFTKEGAAETSFEVLDSYDLDGTEETRDSRAQGAAVSPAKARQINARANVALARSGLLGKVGLSVKAGKITGPTGTYARGVISILRDGKKGWRHTLNHEIVHALRDASRWGASHGLFTPDEWRALVNKARADEALIARVTEAYPDLSAAAQIEEAVAEMYADWARSNVSTLPGPIGKAFDTIRKFFRAVASALRSEGQSEAARVMERIASGEVGGRGPDGPGGGRRADATKERRDLGDEAAQRSAVRKIMDAAIAAGQAAKDAPRKALTKEGRSNLLTDAMGWGDGGQASILSLVPGRALFTELAQHLPSANGYLRTKEEMDATRNEWHSRADTTARKWRKLLSNEKQNTALMDLMHDATLAGIDPSKAFAPKSTSRDPDLAVDPTVHEYVRQQALARLAEDDRRSAIHDDLQARYRALPKEYRDMFKTIRDEYGAMADDMEKAVLENVQKSMAAAVRRAQDTYDKRMAEIRDEGLKGEAKSEAEAEALAALKRAKARGSFTMRQKLAGMRAKFESNRLDGPYFPLARFGDLFVTVRDAAGEVVSFSRFEKAEDQKAFAKEMRESGMSVQAGVLSNGKDVRNSVDPTFVAEVQAMLGDAGVDVDVLDQVWQHWLSTLPDLSLRTNRIHRKGRAGYNRDAFRAFGKQMFHGAHQLTRLRYAVDLDEALTAMEKEAQSAPDPVRAGMVVNEMNRRHQFTMNPTNAAWTQRFSTAAFVWHLAASPAAAAVNLSQTTVVGIPMMAAAFPKQGVKRASAELSKALGDFGRGRGWAEQSKSLTADERAAMLEAYRRGTIDKSQAHDLAGVGETGIEYSARREQVMRVLSFMFHHAERLNREVTFLAIYRMAKADGLTGDAAFEKAAHLAWKVHFDYQSSSKPRFMQGDFQKVLFTFRNFTTNMLWRLFRDSHQALVGADAETRAMARSQLIGLTGSMMFHAGIRGTWGYGIIMMLAGLFFPGGDDEAEEELKRLLVGNPDDAGAVASIRRNLGGMMLNGVPGHLGGLSLSERIGMPNLWFRGSDKNLEGRDAYYSFLDDLLGPSFGLISVPFEAMSAMKEGHIERGIEKAMPSAIRKLMQSGRYLWEGVTTWNGDDLIPEITMQQALVQALGFTPAEVAERYQANRRMMNKQERLMTQRGGIQKEAAKAIIAGERLSQRTLDRINAWNREYPEYPITPQTIRQSVGARLRASQRNEYGIALNPRLNDRIRREQAGMIY